MELDVELHVELTAGETAAFVAALRLYGREAPKAAAVALWPGPDGLTATLAGYAGSAQWRVCATPGPTAGVGFDAEAAALLAALKVVGKAPCRLSSGSATAGLTLSAGGFTRAIAGALSTVAPPCWDWPAARTAARLCMSEPELVALLTAVQTARAAPPQRLMPLYDICLSPAAEARDVLAEASNGEWYTRARAPAVWHMAPPDGRRLRLPSLLCDWLLALAPRKGKAADGASAAATWTFAFENVDGCAGEARVCAARADGAYHLMAAGQTGGEFPPFAVVVDPVYARVTAGAPGFRVAAAALLAATKQLAAAAGGLTQWTVHAWAFSAPAADAPAALTLRGTGANTGCGTAAVPIEYVSGAARNAAPEAAPATDAYTAAYVIAVCAAALAHGPRAVLCWTRAGEYLGPTWVDIYPDDSAAEPVAGRGALIMPCRLD